MQSAPIRRGARRPGDRPRRALVLVLARVIAVAGLAFAGWLALVALTASASAEEASAYEAGAAPATAPAPGGSALAGLPGGTDLATAFSHAPDVPRDIGLRDIGPRGNGGGALRSAAKSRPDDLVPPAPVRRIGDDPVRYLQTKRHEVFDRKDVAVGHVRRLTDAAGVPGSRIADIPENAPLVSGLVRKTAEVELLPAETPSPGETSDRRPSDTETGDAETDDAETDDGAETGGAAAERDAATPTDSVTPGPRCGAPSSDCSTVDEPREHCADCLDDPTTPAPALPSGQDNPRGGGSGGHFFSPVADLQNTRHPAAPSAAGHAVFHRTALTDVSAPAGPSVVPD